MYNLTPTREHKIKSDFGIDDYYKHYKSKNGKLDSHTFKNVLKDFNKGMYEILCSRDYVFKLPRRLGNITIYKYKNYIKVDENGNIKTNLPIDFNSTMQLWKEDPEARENKTLLRYENSQSSRYTFKIVYDTFNANYKNKNVYKMNFNREFKIFLKNKINTKEFDAPISGYGTGL